MAASKYATCSWVTTRFTSQPSPATISLVQASAVTMTRSTSTRSSPKTTVKPLLAGSTAVTRDRSRRVAPLAAARARWAALAARALTSPDSAWYTTEVSPSSRNIGHRRRAIAASSTS